MTQSTSLGDDGTEQALRRLMQDPKAAREAVCMLQEELHSAQGSERQVLVALIALLTRPASGAD